MGQIFFIAWNSECFYYFNSFGLSKLKRMFCLTLLETSSNKLPTSGRLLCSRLLFEQQVEGFSESTGECPRKSFELNPLNADFIALHLLQKFRNEKFRLLH